MFFKKSYESVNAKELKELLNQNINLIDIREPYEIKEGKVRGSKNIPMAGVINNASQFFKKDEKYYIICQSGARSSSACHTLTTQGYDVVNVKGGTGYFSMLFNEDIV